MLPKPPNVLAGLLAAAPPNEKPVLGLLAPNVELAAGVPKPPNVLAGLFCVEPNMPPPAAPPKANVVWRIHIFFLDGSIEEAMTKSKQKVEKILSKSINKKISNRFQKKRKIQKRKRLSKQKMFVVKFKRKEKKICSQ